VIGGLKPYPEMKDAGATSLGAVPAHWQMRKLRGILRRVTERSRPDLPLLSVVRERGVILRNTTEHDENHNFIPDDLSNYKVVRPGQFAMNKMKAWQGSYGVSQYEGIVSPAYFVFDLSDVAGHFFHTAIRSRAYVPSFAQASDGVRIGQWDLAEPRMREIVFAIPPPAEQAAIVRFLDHADRRIRRYIRAKQKLIELLEEQKQAIIHRAVTRGLDPNVRLKPSGVEWLGDVPEHWDVRPAKRFFREVDERSTAGAEELLSVSHLTGVTPRSLKNITMFMAESYAGHKLCRSGDLVINTMWAWMAALGVARQVGIVSPAYGVYRPVPRSPLLGDYADLLLRTRPYVGEYICRSTGIRSSRLRLYPDQFLRIPLDCPPLDEQKAIVEQVAIQTADAASGIAVSQREIHLLREYRTSLIADIVTGKLDVREATANLPVELDDPQDVSDIDDPVLDDETGSASEIEAEATEAETV